MMREYKPNLQNKYIVCRHAAPSYKKYDARDMQNESAGSKGSRGRCGRGAEVRKGLSPSCHLQASEDPGKRGSVPFFPASEGPGKRGSVPFLPSCLLDTQRNTRRRYRRVCPLFYQRSLQMAIRAVPANPRNMSTMPANHHSVSCGPSSICTKNVPRNWPTP